MLVKHFFVPFSIFFEHVRKISGLFCKWNPFTCAPDTNSALKINTFPAVDDALAAFWSQTHLLFVSTKDQWYKFDGFSKFQMGARGSDGLMFSSVCSLVSDADVSNRLKVANVTVNQAFPLMCLNAPMLYRTHYRDRLSSLFKKKMEKKNSYYPHHCLSISVRPQFQPLSISICHFYMFICAVNQIICHLLHSCLMLKYFSF